MSLPGNILRTDPRRDLTKYINLHAIVATRLITVASHSSEVLKLGYDLFISIRSDKSSMVEL
jgi:hypothetical protein